MKDTTQRRDGAAKLLRRAIISLLCLAALFVGAAVAQTRQPAPAEKSNAKQKEKPPITKQELLSVLQSGGIAPERLLTLVKERGVDFQSSVTDEAELGRAGATPELVEAVSANYRPRKKSFAEKWNKTFGTPNGATQAGAATGDAAQGAALNTPAQGDGANAATPSGTANPPAKSLSESVKELREAIKQLKPKKQNKPEAEAAKPSQTPPGDSLPPGDAPPPSR